MISVDEPFERNYPTQVQTSRLRTADCTGKPFRDHIDALLGLTALAADPDLIRPYLTLFDILGLIPTQDRNRDHIDWL